MSEPQRIFHSQARPRQNRKVPQQNYGDEFIDDGSEIVRLNTGQEEAQEILHLPPHTDRPPGSTTGTSSQNDTKIGSVEVIPGDTVSSVALGTKSPSEVTEIKNNIQQSEEGKPSPTFPVNSKKRPQPDRNPPSPVRAINAALPSRATSSPAAQVEAEAYWRNHTQFQRTFPNPDSDITAKKADNSTTHIYDRRTHVFRSKKAFETRPDPLPPPDDIHARQYSIPTPVKKRTSHHFEPPYDSYHEKDLRIKLKPDTLPVVAEQLISETRGIYAGLVMVEKKTVEIDAQQAQNHQAGYQTSLDQDQWSAMVSLHRTLLHEYHDFFLTTQHPNATPGLRRVAVKYGMPNRFWRHGIHTFLELLRHRLPASLDHMITFIHFVYSLLCMLKEACPVFEDAWHESLGDVARYRMAVEEADMRERESWTQISRYWYNKTADKNPYLGRIQHHLAVLATPNLLQQLFYFSKALTCLDPFHNTTESLLVLFDPILDGKDAVIHRYLPVDIAFVKAHGILIKQGDIESFNSNTDKFLSLLDNNIGRVTARWREQGVWISTANFWALLSCIGPGATEPLFEAWNKVLLASSRQAPASITSQGMQNPRSIPVSKAAIETAKRAWEALGSRSPQAQDMVPDDGPRKLDRHSLAYASHLTFSTMAITFQRIGDKNVLPCVHISLVFLLCASLVPEVMVFIEPYVPWELLVRFLNTLSKPGVRYDIVENDEFPATAKDANTYLPEDFVIRGPVWTHQYYPAQFFADCPLDEEERTLELPSMASARIERCLWLAIRLSQLDRRISYDYASKKFAVNWQVELSGSRSRTLSIQGEDTNMEDVPAS